METIEVNGVRLAYELHDGEGVPLVFVHGGWGSRRGLVHEAPLLSLLDDDPSLARLAEETWQQIRSTAGRVATGDHAGAAEQFVEEIALGPGAWALIPSEFKDRVVGNAPAFLAEAGDRDQLRFDPESVKTFSRPTLLTVGRTSPAWLQAIVPKLTKAMPHAEVVTFEEAGHVPHFTHPDVFTATIVDFVGKHSS